MVRLTLFQNLVDYIQSRGRARRSDSRYVVLLEQGNEEAKSHYLSTVAKEEEMNSVLMNKDDVLEAKNSDAYLLRPEVRERLANATGNILAPRVRCSSYNSHCPYDTEQVLQLDAQSKSFVFLPTRMRIVLLNRFISSILMMVAIFAMCTCL